MTQLLLADLHLPPEPSRYKDAFRAFCLGPAQAAREVFFLGDIFAWWVSDTLGLEDFAAEAALLRGLADRGVRLHFCAGNRDFMLGRRFARAAGLRRMADEEVHHLGGVPTLLTHGDQYCWADTRYQRYRRIVRFAPMQWAFMVLPMSKKRDIARRLRGQNQGMREDAARIVDVSDAAITDAFRRHRVQHLVHGHTHRPALHSLTVDGLPATRRVLPDWRPDRMPYCQVDADGVWSEHELAAV